MVNTQTNEILPKTKMSGLYRFFAWCSGARLYLLKYCPTDYNKYFGIGIIVFLTGLMASITGSYALFTIFNSIPVALVFGVFWGILIFFLDWFIISSLKKEEKFGKELLFSLPRIILAILLAMVIATPLELKLFEKEINAELIRLKSQNVIEYKNLLNTEFDEINKLKAENQKLLNEIKEKEKNRNELFDKVIKEAEGQSPTGIVGKGPVYREKKAELDRLDKQLEQINKTNREQIDLNNKRINELEQVKTTKTQINKAEIEKSDGLLARLQALSALREQNATLNTAVWFIFILFILIEAAPILVKLLSRRGPYDELLEKEEYEKQIEYKKQKIKARVLANNYIELLKQKDELQVEAEKRNNEKLIKEIEQAKEDINKKVVEKWKEYELQQVKDLELIKNDFKENDETENKIESENETVNQETEHKDIIQAPENIKQEAESEKGLNELKNANNG